MIVATLGILLVVSASFGAANQSSDRGATRAPAGFSLVDWHVARYLSG